MNSRVLFLDKEDVDKYHKMMRCKTLDYEEHDIPRYSTIKSWTIVFDNGYEIDLKVCSSDYNDPLWCEAVLFNYGNEHSYSDVSDTLDGLWVLCSGDKEFCLQVCIK